MGAFGRETPQRWVTAGIISESEGNFEEALGHLERAIEVDAGHVMAYQVKGTDF